MVHRGVRLALVFCLAGLAASVRAQGVADEDRPKMVPPPIPDEVKVDYGPYVHYYKTRASADFKRQSQKILANLRGLNRACPTCKTNGLIKVVIREGFYDRDNNWIPPVEDVRDCPTCDRRKYVYNEGAARAFVERGLPPDSRMRRGSEFTRRDLLRRLERSKSTYRSIPKTKYEIRGRYAILTANTRDGVFPLHFHLVPQGTKFAWYLHDPSVSGEFNLAGEFEGLPSDARVTEVYAGDVIRIGRRRVCRLAGITIPGVDGKVAKKRISSPNSEVRALVREELLGKTVNISTDKYAQFTCRGLPLAFIAIDGKDYAVELVRRGIARRHPKHKTQKNKTFMDAEKEARANKAGVWARILKK
jgi:endonuclease YncB( thermonuclease family)